jgi:nitrogen regulatory protein PII-like uncharacterized protein
MKDFLQLDGMVYKLIPVKNAINKDDNRFDMGQIDTDVMFKNVMAWDWGNGNSTKIYHDPETRRNAISYRTNMARLIEQLLKENKLDKAKKVLDLGMQKMPVEQYEYYTMLEPFVSGYYDVNQAPKAQKLLSQLFKKYQENLLYYNGLKVAEQNNLYADIVTDLYRYQALLDIVESKDKSAFFEESKKEYSRFRTMFARFNRE